MPRPDYEDDSNHVLPSFKSIRQKTLSTLYEYEGDHRDKSPKGSVDVPIQGLVDRINSHPSFATLSSCSGRIALFDPAGASVSPTDGASVDVEMAATGEPSGKGNGHWLLAAHEKVSLEQVQAQLEIEDNKSNTSSHQSMMSFRFEPMLLHVAACNLERGKQLLQIALQRGFRESGLVVTASRITVAIRSYSLALTIPLMRSGPWQVSTDYLSGLVEECNDRLEKNWKRLCDLDETIRKTLFHVENLPRMSIAGFQKLPDLNLWGQACVTMAFSNDSGESIDILTFGGYGTGPHTKSMTKVPTGATRCDRIYKMRQSVDGFLDEAWTEVSVEKREISKGRICGLSADPIDWSPRERSAACLFRQTSDSSTVSNIALIFGGRKSPSAPLADLILFEYKPKAYSSFYQLKGIAGTPPSARWGHTFTSISGEFACLIGGRNADSVVGDSFFILSTHKNNAEEISLQWEAIDRFADTFCRFDHASCATSENIIVFGGVNEASDLLAPFSNTLTDSSICIVSGIGDMSNMAIDCLRDVPCGFGLEACILQERIEGPYNKVQVLLSGGVAPKIGTNRQPITAIDLTKENDKWTASNISTMVLPDYTVTGPLVSHSQVLLSRATNANRGTFRLVCVGGGTAGFSFRPCFARSFCLELILDEDLESRDTHEKIASKSKERITTNALVEEAPPETTVKNPDVPVVFVKKQNAKQVKVLMESLGYLSETHRMAPALNAHSLGSDQSQLIALPIKLQAVALLDEANYSEPPWRGLIEGTGQQVLPFRTAMFARK